MKALTYKLFAITVALVALSAFTTKAQVADPASLNVYNSATAITVDGILTEGIWNLNTPTLKFKIGGTPSGVLNTVTNFAVVKGNYVDTTTTLVKFAKVGKKLYIALKSDDKQVCRFGDSWEGDGLFMKIKKADGSDVEVKLYYNLAGINPEIHLEAPSSVVGAAVKGTTTIVNDSTNTDNGYTAELMIPLDSLGYTTTDSVKVLMNIFDPDNYNDGVGAWGANGSYAKQWWGSEWGPDMRTLKFVNAELPVELTSLSATTSNNSVIINWKTATELNNRGFEIERSINGASFEKIGFITGYNTSTTQHSYSYVDNNPVQGKISYRLKQIDNDGSFTFTNAVNVDFTSVSEFALAQNYPNPFNPSTTISFSLPQNSNVTIAVYNMVGELVSTVVKAQFEAGSHKVNFDASKLSSGLYIYKMNATSISGASFTASNKMLLMK